MAQLKTYKQRVRSLLEKYPNARNNDGTLIAHYIFEYHHNLVFRDIDGQPAINLRNFKNLPAVENIRRSRQLIQNNDGELLPTDPEVVKSRKIKETNWSNAEVREAKAPLVLFDV